LAWQSGGADRWAQHAQAGHFPHRSDDRESGDLIGQVHGGLNLEEAKTACIKAPSEVGFDTEVREVLLEIGKDEPVTGQRVSMQDDFEHSLFGVGQLTLDLFFRSRSLNILK
jgi:hypothetical protein